MLSSVLPDLPWPVLATIPFIILAAYTMFGATGFGSSIIAVPLLAHVLPLTYVVPLTTLLDAGSTANASARQWRRADFAEFRRLLPPMVIGIATGAALLVRLPRGPALFALGAFVLLYGLHLLRGPREWRAARKAWAWPVGFGGGLLSVLFGTGGPVYMVYLSARIHDKTALRATSSIVVTVSVAIRAVVFVANGLLLEAPVVVAALVLMPVVLGGYALGNRVHFALSRNGVLTLIAVLLVVNGGLLVARAVALLNPS
jgi:uncharacterized membrane protein YfcA